MAGLLLARMNYAKVTASLAVVLAVAGGAAWAAGGDADTVNGIDFKKFEFRTGLDAAERQILKAGDLRVTASCTAGVLTLEVSTLQNNAAYYSDSNVETESVPDFDASEPASIAVGSDGAEVDAIYQPRRGKRVGLQFLASDSDAMKGTVECLVSGFAFAGDGTNLGTGSAGSVDGVNFKRVDYAEEDSPVKTILSAGTFDVNAECSIGPSLDLQLITRQSDATMYSSGASGIASPDFDEPSPESISSEGEEDIAYEPQTGPAVASQLLSADGVEFPDPTECLVAGVAFYK